MFGFFAKKATISLEIHSSEVKFSDILSGNISIRPEEDSTLEAIEFEFNWKQDGVFSNDESFKRTLNKSVFLVKEQDNNIPFEIDFVTREEVNNWYRSNSMSRLSTWDDLGDGYDGSANSSAFLQELKTWDIKVSVRIGGSTVSASTEIGLEI